MSKADKKGIQVFSVEPTGAAERVEGSDLIKLPRVGEWYWVKFSTNDLTKEERAADDLRNIKLLPKPKRGEPGFNAYKARAGEAQDQPAEYEQLRCVVNVGSNYVETQSLHFKTKDGGYDSDARGGATHRYHLDAWEENATREYEADVFIMNRVEARQGNVKQLMGEVQEITRRLGIGQQSIGPGDEQKAAAAETGALVRVTDGVAVSDFKRDLVKAKEKTLPELFGRLKVENYAMAAWMTASTIPFKAAARGLEPLVARIDARVFNVELYAGLCETVVQVRDGEPAAVGEPIRIMQRRAYMDEECLADYDKGGIKYTKIAHFDRWMARPHNMERLMPHQRCVLAFKVRREKEDRSEEYDAAHSLFDFIGIAFGESARDKLNEQTFLYLRNGEQLFRLSTALDFGASLFPDHGLNQLTGKLYGKPDKWGKGEWTIITEGDYLQRVEKARLHEEEYDAEYKEHKYWQTLHKIRVRAWNRSPEGKRLAVLKEMKHEEYRLFWGDEPLGRELKALEEMHHLLIEVDKPEYFGPHHDHDVSEDAQGWSVFNDSNVKFDDIQKALKEQLDRHNRLVLVLQGLLDRSPTFAPHPKWELWTEVGFNSALKLVYDSSRALVPSQELPDYEAFRAATLKTLKVGDVTFGQQDLYRAARAAEYNERHKHERNFHPFTRYLPPGDPGPGKLAYVQAIRGPKVTFKWMKQRRRNAGNYFDPENMEASFTCDVRDLFNVSAYTPGGYKTFFADPRTRAKYLQWAPALLTAEDFHAGVKKVKDPKKKHAREDREESDERVRDW